MVQKRRTKKKLPKLKFELSRGAVTGVGVVLFCLFLWMYLFGIWTGQTILSPLAVVEKSRDIENNKVVPFIKAVEKKRIISKKVVSVNGKK